jgi:hypothetical protein
MTLSIIDTQRNNALQNAECNYAKCHILFIVMLSVITLNVIMLIVVAPANTRQWNSTFFKLELIEGSSGKVNTLKVIV